MIRKPPQLPQSPVSGCKFPVDAEEPKPLQECAHATAHAAAPSLEHAPAELIDLGGDVLGRSLERCDSGCGGVLRRTWGRGQDHKRKLPGRPRRCPLAPRLLTARALHRRLREYAVPASSPGIPTPTASSPHALSQRHAGSGCQVGHSLPLSGGRPPRADRAA